MRAINNIVRATSNIINAATSTVSVSAQVVADSTELLNDSVKQAPGILAAILALPLAATKGYLVQEGMSVEAAEEQAYRFVRQPLARTIAEVGEGTGKLLADLLKEDNLNDAVSRIEQTQ